LPNLEIKILKKDTNISQLICKILSKTKKFAPLFFILIGIWTLPWPMIPPGSGLDPSWVIGINMALLENLQFGKDIVFTFGPLGFLWTPVLIDYNLWSLSLFFCIFFHILFIGSIFLLLRKLPARWYHYIMLIPILIFAVPSPDFKLPITALIFIYTIILSTKSNWKDLVWLILLGFLLSIASLIKFNMFLISTSIILASFLTFTLARKGSKYGICLLLSYFIFLISLWLIGGQDTSNLIGYLLNGIEISSGYTAAMAIQGPSWHVYVGLISILSLVLLFIYSVRENKRNTLFFLLLNLGILFSAFKYGFVRHDLHILCFFRVYLLFFGLFLIITPQEISKTKKISYSIISLNTFMILILMFSIYLVAPWILNDNIMTKSSSYGLAASFLTNPTLFHETVESHKERIRKDYPLGQQIVEYIDGKAVDIFPWDIALCWAYNFNWYPRPVFQSYSAYTQHLDKINSKHFTANSSPQAILYAYKSIDGRYPLFDEPATFRSILCNYTYLNKSGEFIVLKHSINAGKCDSEVTLGTIKAKIGQIIQIPKYNNGFVFGYIELNYSLLGKIMRILYKPSTAYVQFRFKFKDTTYYSKKFRFIPDVAKNGVLLSQYVGNINDLKRIFSGKVARDIDAIVLSVDKPLHYKRDVRVRFIGVPANINITNYLPLYNIEPTETNLLPQQYFISGVGVINGELRPIIYEHPITSDRAIIAFKNIAIPEKAKLRFSIALDPNVWSPEKGDGVVFEIYIKENKSEKLLFSKYIDPKNNPEDRKWNDFEVDLSAWQGKR